MTTDHMELRAAASGDQAEVCISRAALVTLLAELDSLSARGNRGMITFQTFLARCKDRKEQPIPDGSNVFAYAEMAGISSEVLRIHWMEFKARYMADAKLYRDWRKAFNNSVRGNWFKLWYFDNTGACCLTTTGLQAKNSAEAVQKRAA